MCIKSRLFKTKWILSIAVVFIGLLLGQGLAQQQQQIQQAQAVEELELKMNASWQHEQLYVQTFPTGDYIPIYGEVNRDAYIYLFIIYPNEFVSLNYPKNYDPTKKDNVVWKSLDKTFARFIPTADFEGIWTFILVASLEPLKPEELEWFDVPVKFIDPVFSTEFVDVEIRQARVSKGSMISQLVKEASGLWPYFQYVRDNDLFNE